MERDLPQTQTTLCRAGCGFYGSSATDSLCSKCYKDALKRKQAAPTSSGFSPSVSSSVDSSNQAAAAAVAAAIVVPTSLLPPTQPISVVDNNNGSSQQSVDQDAKASCATADKSLSVTTTISAIPSTDVAGPAADTKVSEKKKKKTRCTKCKVNVGVIGFPCRCGGMFCSVHRYANEHSCSFDYKEHGAEEIRKNNPQVVGEKIQKI